MKKILLLSLALVSSIFAQTPVNIQKVSGNLSADFSVATGRTITIASGGTLTIASGATFTFPAASIPWTAITSTPTTLAGYGILDGVSTAGSYSDPIWLTSLAATKLTGFIAAARMPAFTGDITTSAGAVATTLATVNTNTGSWGTATSVPTFTVNGKGLLTAAANTTISIPSTAISDSTTTGRALMTTASSSAARTTLGLATVASTGSYTDLINQPTFNSFSPMTTLGDIIYENATPAGARLAGNTTATNKFLTQTGTGSLSAAPAWNTLVNGDVPTALTGKTYNGLTATAVSVGFTIAGGTTSKTLTVPLDSTVSGTNTGDQTISITGDVTAAGSTGALASTVTKVNGVAFSGLATGILKNTTTTGVPSIASAGTDYQAPGSYITALTGDATASGPGSAAATVVKVNGVTYAASPSTNTVAVVTGTNATTYETVPNAALANSTITIGSTSTALGATSTTIAGLTLTNPTINGATSSGSTTIDLSGNSGAFKTPTGANQLSGAVTVADATTPSVTTSSGKTNTGFVQINGKTSGGLKITTADATGFTVTMQPAAQSIGNVGLTIPDFASVSDTFAFVTRTATFTNKTLGSGTAVTNAITYTAGVTQTFAPNTTSSGLNVGSFAGVPSSLNNGDIFYDSTGGALKARSGGSTITLGAGGAGTVTNTGGSLTANAFVLGAGGNDTKVVAGIVTDGVSGVTLGVAGASVGNIGFNNATSGKITLQPVTGALGAVTLSLPAATDTLTGKATTDTLTNKTINGSSNTLTVLAASQLSGFVPTANGGNNLDITTSAPNVIGGFGFRNRVINGDQRIDQRNEGGSISVGSKTYVTDRWTGTFQTANATLQQVTDAPTGFVDSLKVITGTGASPGAGNFNVVTTRIEGNNVADFLLGTASATTITESFWVKSSVTGTYSCYNTNQAGNRSYPGQYTINSANTWEKKTITLTGDTTGTWATDNTIGIYMGFDLGSGATQEGTSSTWQAGNITRISSNTKLVASTAATWQVTGAQFEMGATASAFEIRPRGLELQLCQRYFEKSFNQGTKPVQSAGQNTGEFMFGSYRAATAGTYIQIPMRVVKRTASSTVTFYNPGAGNTQIRDFTVSADFSSTVINGGSLNSDTVIPIFGTSNGSTAVGDTCGVHWTADADF